MGNKEEVKQKHHLTIILTTYDKWKQTPNQVTTDEFYKQVLDCYEIIPDKSKIASKPSPSPDINEKVKGIAYKLIRKYTNPLYENTRAVFDTSFNPLVNEFASEITELFEVERIEDKRVIEFYIGEHTNFISTFTEQREIISSLTSKLKEAEEEVKRLKEANKKINAIIDICGSHNITR